MGEQLWLDEEPAPAPASGPPARRRPPRMASTVMAAVVVVVMMAVVAVPLTLVATSGSQPKARSERHVPTASKGGPAQHQVLSALSATTAAGSFDFSYTMDVTPATSAPPTTTTTVCRTYSVPVPVAATVPPGTATGSATGSASGSVSSKTVTECSGPAPANRGVPITGNGVMDVSPKAMVVGATLGKPSNLQVTVRVDDTTLYETLGQPDPSLAPADTAASGQTLSSFAGLAESTIGPREGAVSMLGLASPTGYLDLYQQDVGSATETGKATVDGVAVTVYSVSVDPSELASGPGVSAEETDTATAAWQVLEAQGYTGTTDTVSVDGAGYIRQVRSVANFSDGGTVVLTVTLSNFGCAGTVLMPGQQGSGAAPAGCTSPDTAGSPPS
jgi:hypothetical protein